MWSISEEPVKSGLAEFVLPNPDGYTNQLANKLIKEQLAGLVEVM